MWREPRHEAQHWRWNHAVRSNGIMEGIGITECAEPSHQEEDRRKERNTRQQRVQSDARQPHAMRLRIQAPMASATRMLPAAIQTHGRMIGAFVAARMGAGFGPGLSMSPIGVRRRSAIRRSIA